MHGKVSYSDFAKINSIGQSRPLVLFGAGNICAKTLLRLTNDPACIVDNSANLWGTYQSNLEVLPPEKLNEFDKKPFVIICTTSFPEVAFQLIDMGFSGDDEFTVSPVLNDWRAVEEVECATATLLLTSGLSSSGTTKGNGGLYKIRINKQNFEVEQIIEGSAHGIIKCDKSVFVIEDNLGIVELDEKLSIVRSEKLPAGTRPHGLSWSPDTKSFYVACSYLDQVLELDIEFNIKRRIDISPKSQIRCGPHHHVNDCLAWGDSLFVSMFSLTGNWKKDVFDGGIREIHISTGEVVGDFAYGLWMPHNVSNINGSMAVLDSLPGSLLIGNLREAGNFPGFSRGLAWDDQYVYIGQSRNRNFSNQIGLSNNISLDSGVVVFDSKTKLSKTIQLPRSITEIHGLLVLTEE